MPPRRANAIGAGSAETPEAGSEFVNEPPDRAGRPRRPPRKARRRVIAGGYGEEEQRRAAGCIGRPATGGDSFTASEQGALSEVRGEMPSARATEPPLAPHPVDSTFPPTPRTASCPHLGRSAASPLPRSASP